MFGRKNQLAALRPVDVLLQTTKRKSKGGGKVVAITVERGSFAERLMQAGIDWSPNVYMALVCLISGIAAYMAMLLGPMLALFVAFGIASYSMRGYLDERAMKRRKLVVPQLPAFIDSLASALGTGFNIEGAVIQATEGVPPGLLRVELDRVTEALQRGMNVADAFAVMKRRVAGKEITSIAVALQLFHGMGGRVLEPFRRLADKIRQQQQVVERANRDLVQVKQAFYMLLFLSLGAPLLLAVIQPNYLKGAFSDSFGRLVLQIAAILQIVAILVFKKITNLKL